MTAFLPGGRRPTNNTSPVARRAKSLTWMLDSSRSRSHREVPSGETATIFRGGRLTKSPRSTKSLQRPGGVECNRHDLEVALRSSNDLRQIEDGAPAGSVQAHHAGGGSATLCDRYQQDAAVAAAPW